MEMRNFYEMGDDSVVGIEQSVEKVAFIKCEKIVFIWVKNDVIEIFKATSKQLEERIIIIVCNFNM